MLVLVVLVVLGVRGWWTSTATVAGLAAVTGASFWSSPHPTALWAPALWAASALFYLSFRNSTYEDLNTFGKTVVAVVGGIALHFGRWLETGRVSKNNAPS
jgi:hypothetical protein